MLFPMEARKRWSAALPLRPEQVERDAALVRRWRGPERELHRLVTQRYAWGPAAAAAVPQYVTWLRLSLTASTPAADPSPSRPPR